MDVRAIVTLKTFALEPEFAGFGAEQVMNAFVCTSIVVLPIVLPQAFAIAIFEIIGHWLGKG